MNIEKKLPLEYALRTAHYQAAFRNNASTVTLKNAWQCNGNQYIPAITAAMQTFGGLHAPIKYAYKLLRKLRNSGGPDEMTAMLMRYYGLSQIKVPGFGSSFFRGGEKDPLLSALEIQIPDYWAIVASRIRTHLLSQGKVLQPNLAFYTAVVMIELEININLCESIMLEARLQAWNKILSEL